MPRKGGVPENLTNRKKGDKALPGAGRKKGIPNRATILKRWLSLEETIKNPITGEFESLTQADILILEQLKKARKGDVHAYDRLLKEYYDCLEREKDRKDKSQQQGQQIKINIVNGAELD